MTDKELETLLHELVEEKFNEAWKKMIKFHKCELVYNEMCKAGYGEPMQAFKNIVLYSIIINPDITEEELLTNFFNKIMNRENDLQKSLL